MQVCMPTNNKRAEKPLSKSLNKHNRTVPLCLIRKYPNE